VGIHLAKYLSKGLVFQPKFKLYGEKIQGEGIEGGGKKKRVRFHEKLSGGKVGVISGAPARRGSMSNSDLLVGMRRKGRRQKKSNPLIQFRR